MVKKEIDEIPVLGQEEESEDVETEPIAELKEEEKLQIVTSEQLTQFKLDNISLQVQQTDSKIQELIEHVKALVEVLRKRK